MELAVGGIYEGKVTGITKYGAFVNFDGGKSGLVHISEVANSFVSDVAEYVKVGQSIRVKVLAINEGKINLSIKQVPAEDAPREKPEKPAAEAVPRYPSQVRHDKYNMAPVPPANSNSGSIDFEDRLKKFMQESDSRIADSRRYERKAKTRRR